jgi:hypothetical protein
VNVDDTARSGPAHAGRDDAGVYEICLLGRLDERWSVCFDGMTLSTSADGTTVLRGHLADQAALHGHLARLRDLGLPLVSVTRMSEPAAADVACESAGDDS